MNRLNEYMIGRGLSQKDVAAAVGVSRPTVSTRFTLSEHGLLPRPVCGPCSDMKKAARLGGCFYIVCFTLSCSSARLALFQRSMVPTR